MPADPATVLDLSSLNLAYGEGKRIQLPVRLAPFELGGQTYQPRPETVSARLDVSRPSGGFAFHLTFPVHLQGPCMRCLEDAALELGVDAREVHQLGIEAEELHSPYVDEDELDLGRWAHDATMLALPTQILCRPDCLGLCAVCGESLNDADPADHEHETGHDPRWAKLNDLKLD